MPAATTGQITRTLIGLPERCACVERPWRGHYVYIAGVPETPARSSGFREAEFYAPFAQFVAQREGCRCVVIGGARLGPLTPDVAAITPAGDIIAGELKVNHSNYTRGFGQAFGYRVYAQRSWLAVPRSLRPPELELLADQCRLGGIGLAVFDIAAQPNFAALLPAVSGTPSPQRHAEKLAQLRPELGLTDGVGAAHSGGPSSDEEEYRHAA